VQLPFPATRHIPAFAVIEIKKPPTVHSTNNVGCNPVWLPSCFSRCFQISLISISYQKVFLFFLGVPLRKTGKSKKTGGTVPSANARSRERIQKMMQRKEM
jgi:hypothetical protein